MLSLTDSVYERVPPTLHINFEGLTKPLMKDFDTLFAQNMYLKKNVNMSDYYLAVLSSYLHKCLICMGIWVYKIVDWALDFYRQ